MIFEYDSVHLTKGSKQLYKECVYVSRATIQVPDELKVEIENLKDKFNAKTTYGVIESLIQIYKDFQNYKQEIKEKARLEKRL